MYSQIDTGFKWFVANYKELFKIYGNSFLVIKDSQVVTSFKTFSEAYKYARETFGLGNFIIQQSTSSPEGFTNSVISTERRII